MAKVFIEFTFQLDLFCRTFSENSTSRFDLPSYNILLVSNNATFQAFNYTSATYVELTFVKNILIYIII